MKRNIILFDLDGTLTDPKQGITASVAYALKCYGIEVPDLDRLIPFIGPPLKDSFMEFYGFSEGQALEAVEKYREYFTPTGIFENRLYTGVPEMLAALKADNRKIMLATSKPEPFALRILEHFGLTEYFDFICGSELSGGRPAKADVIAHVLTCCNITELEEVIMVGDRRHDIEGAHKCGVQACGVLFGYGSREELEACGADFIAEDIAQLKDFLLKGDMV